MSRLTRHCLLLAFFLTLIAITLAGRSVAPDPAEAQAAPTATPDPLTYQTHKFQTIHMVDAMNGWAVITVTNPNGYFIRGDTYAGLLDYVMHTQDGGQTWANVTPPLPSYLRDAAPDCECSDNGLMNTFFLDASHAWITYDDGKPYEDGIIQGLAVVSTSDGGKSWSKGTALPDAEYVIASDYIDTKHGWLMLAGLPIGGSTESALLLQTSDASQNWNLIADDGTNQHYDPYSRQMTGPISLKNNLTTELHHSMAFESTRSGWLSVSWLDGSTGMLLHTTDGGRTWHPVTVPGIPTQGDDDCIIDYLTIPAAKLVTFEAYCLKGEFLYRSSDHGKTWQSFPTYDPISLSMLSATNGWLIGCQQPANSTVKECDRDPSATLTVNETTDGGKTWVTTGQTPSSLHPSSDPAFDIPDSYFDFIDDHTGWLIDLSGNVFMTADSGKTWTPIKAAVDGARN